ncbi:HAD hydrolase-like protein [Sphingosinicellaceae bacterium]|nr:HAD hydrolase-like protein [Sphingosinicellaceae bacterium]
MFDVDGTLYRQKPLRWTMLRMLARDALASRSPRTLKVLADYRREREALADDGVEDFDAKLIAGVAARTRLAPAVVEGIVADWIETRPLPHLRRAMVTGAPALFEALRRSGRTIGVLSDYPAVAKIAALGLEANHIVAARDVGLMKPSARGLLAVIAAAGASPAATVMIGDRDERDGAAADAAGVRVLLRSSPPVAGRVTFADFTDPVFAPLLAGTA